MYAATEKLKAEKRLRELTAKVREEAKDPKRMPLVLPLPTSMPVYIDQVTIPRHVMAGLLRALGGVVTVSGYDCQILDSEEVVIVQEKDPYGWRFILRDKDLEVD